MGSSSITRDVPPRGPILEGPFDLAIIGGGINGAAIAREAVLRGLRVCLLEKGDFGSGTSSQSSKMLHGGIRYLEQGHLGLVFESLRERAIQLRAAPHLSRAQPFVIPVYAGSPRGLKWIRAGLKLYDFLCFGRGIGKSRPLPPAEILALAPGLLPDGLLGGGLYFDGVMDDARICLANILDARQAAGPGQLQARNYAEVLDIQASSPLVLEVQDRIFGKRCRVQAHRVVRAVGPWTDAAPGERPLLVPSKGIHIVLPRLFADGQTPHGLLLTHSRDRRAFFIIPWKDRTIVGTTETSWRGPPESLRVEREEVEYLLGEVQRLFPGRQMRTGDILATFAGIRPLAASRWNWAAPGRISRRHRIVDGEDGVLTVVGGKYTTYRAVAEEVVRRIHPGGRSPTRLRPLHGGELGGWDEYRRGPGLPWIDQHGEPAIRRLFDRYGSRLEEVAALIRANPRLAEPLSPDHPELAAEVVHGILREDVVFPEDFLCRRSDLRFARGNGRDAYDAVEALIREHSHPAGASPDDLARARAAYLQMCRREEELRLGGLPAPAR